ncbi:MAG: hypothetical protein ACTHOE_13265 [Conexibacter sp.]
MDSADRDFATLAALGTALLGECVCGLLAFVLLPLLGGAHPLRLACLALGGLLAAPLLLGARAAVRQLSASRRLAGRVRALTTPASAAVREATEATGLSGRVDLLDGDERACFVQASCAPAWRSAAGSWTGCRRASCGRRSRTSAATSAPATRCAR